MTFNEGHAWLHFSHRYRVLFGAEVPDWVTALRMEKKLDIVRVACRLRMRLATRVLVPNESFDSHSQWG